MPASLGSALDDPYKDYTLSLSVGGHNHFGNKRTGLIPPLEVANYRAGGDPSTSFKPPGRVKYDPITLNRGVTAVPSFSNWASQVSSALLSSADVAEYRDGSNAVNTPRKGTGRSGFDNITLNRGVTQDQGFSNWANSVHSYGSNSASQVSPANYRKDILLQFYNEAGQLVVWYQINRHWLVEFGGGGVFHHPLHPRGVRRLREQLAAIFESSLQKRGPSFGGP